MNMREQIIHTVDQIADELLELAKRIFNYRELAFEEFQSSKALMDYLSRKGFSVESNTAGLETAFLARYGQGKPHIALLCEYDALPEIGHACGHNMIGVIGVGAAVAQVLAGVPEQYPGTITVVGCPAEERGSAKSDLVKAGVFDDVDAALIIHPSSMSTGFDIAYAIQRYQIEFFGKSAHAAADPVQGINALDAMVSFFGGLGLMRQQLAEKTRVHGIIKNGGQSFNTIPEYTSAEIGVRALRLDSVKQLAKKVEKLAKGAATMTGCSYQMELLDEMPDVYTNVPLAEQLDQNYGAVGEEIGERTYEQGAGSTDVGAVTYAVPAIQGYINITAGEDIATHTREFAEAANSDYGYQAMIRAIKALALTSYDLLSDPSLVEQAKQYFENGERRTVS
ncbi:amidohydrolase [candidate division KSB3 bacterium]|uniref:Peptidase M20 domain-containing protein 2 n=1 Tax=candidate division KSB3 bacterium TaxID=2044937 RepID=A0A2G6KHL5_9BACT|nr:MAG: amidohydrolase [candidate division KSB3 bacterium]